MISIELAFIIHKKNVRINRNNFVKASVQHVTVVRKNKATWYKIVRKVWRTLLCKLTVHI